MLLGIEKFKHPKHYRLIWIHDERAWLSQDETEYDCKADAVLAGRKLAKQFRVKFDEGTR